MSGTIVYNVGGHLYGVMGGDKIMEEFEKDAKPQLSTEGTTFEAVMEEIKEEYQKAVKAEWIHKPLAKALYEVWKKHNREDVSRHEGL